MHLVYVDDSKDTKLACFSALLVPEDSWNEYLNRLIGIRRAMKDVDGVPLRMELHTTDWVAGKGNRVHHLDKTDRVRLYNYFLAGIAMLPGVQLINAAVPVGQDVRAFEWRLNRINRNMRDAGSNALIISDEGKSYDKLLRRMRRFNFIPSKLECGKQEPYQKIFGSDESLKTLYIVIRRDLFLYKRQMHACTHSFALKTHYHRNQLSVLTNPS
jgi:hypothetical protein